MKIKTRTRYRIIGSDYSAQEPRLTTFMSKDPNMYKAYLEGKDLYCVIAQNIFHNKYEDNLEFWPEGHRLMLDDKEIVCGNKTHVNPEGKHRRKIAKMVLLALTYGMSASTLAQRINSTREEAQSILDDFFSSFPKVKELIEKSQADLRKNGYVEDWAGRRRHLPDIYLAPYEVSLTKKEESEIFNPILGCQNKTIIDSRIVKWQQIIQDKLKEATRRFKAKELSNKVYEQLVKDALKDGVIIKANTARIAQAERQCLNARIQGGAASLTKLAMINVSNDKILKECKARILISVHDELLVEAPVLYSSEVEKRLPQVMIETAAKYIDVPMSCDPYCVSNWYADTYSNTLQNEYEDLSKKNHDTALAIMIKNHPEIPEQILKDCVLKDKEINLEDFDN